MKLITPNNITCLRIVLAVVAIILFITQSTWQWWVFAFVLVVAGMVRDAWDGWLARKTGLVTNLGKILDPIADKLLVLGVMGVFSYLGTYGALWVVIIGVREVVVTAVRLVLASKGRVLAAERLGKWKTGLQCTSISVTYVYLMARDFLPTSWAGTSVTVNIMNGANYLFLGIVVVLTLVSGFSFFKSLRST